MSVLIKGMNKSQNCFTCPFKFLNANVFVGCRLPNNCPLVEVIRDIPSAEVEPVKRGKWIYDNQFHWYRASCSECGYMRATDIKADNWNGWKYCPNCGAKMENEDGEL